ncbi:MAG TPA: hypothetical protein VF085_02680 [Solirubrobacterales bacterium]
MGIADSAKAFFVGPVWRLGGAVSGLVGAVGLVQALDDQSLDTLWKWLFLASLALVAAAFWSFHRSRVQMEAKKQLLPHQIDDLQREGKVLLAELEAPAEPEVKNGVTTISGEWASDEWWDKVEAFEKRIRGLFIERYPALLSDYANGANEHLRKRREATEAEASDEDKRSTPQKVLAMANEMRSGPARRMEASLEGLTAARHRVGTAESI